MGVVGLQEARAEAKRRLAEYTLGKHRPRAVSWTTALSQYLAEVEEKRRKSTHNEYERILNKYFRFGDTRMSEIGANDLHRDLDKIKSSEHFHAYITLRAFIRWAHRKHYLDKNPMERMQRPEPSKPRARILTDEELKRIWTAAGDGHFGNIVKLLILTGQRRGEISKLTAAMIKDNSITFPTWLTKNGREHTFPIGLISKSMLPKSLRQDRPDRFLFPARTSNQLQTPFNGFSKSKSVLDKRSSVSNWTLHDLRRTFASGLAAQGVSLPVIERILNHVSGSFGGIVGVYQRYDFFPEMKAAVEKWEGHLLTLLKS